MLLGFVFQSPGPVLWEIGPISVRWYGFLIAMAVLLGVTLSQYLAQKRAINPDLIADLAIWLVVGAIPAARLYYVLFQWQEYAQNPADIIAIWKGGIAIHGAIIGGLLASLIFARINRVSLWQLLDLVAPSVILGQAIGRWGNFFNSEAFGSPTNLPWKLFIPPASRPLKYITVDYFHPTFLYESLWNLTVFALLIYLFFWGLKHPSKLKIGTLTLVYFIAYSLGRFWIEGLRTDSLMFGPLKMAQIISLGAIAIGIFGLFWLYKLQRPLPDVVATVSYNQKLPQLTLTMDLVTIFQQVLNGLSIGSVYAIFALGYTLIFSILGIINFAHGAIFTLGAYFTYALAGGVFGFNGLLANAKLPFSLPFFLALFLGCILSGFTSVLLERLAFKPLRVRGSDSLLTLVSSLGAAVVIVNVIQYLFGAEIYTFPDGIYGNLPPAINFGTADRPVAIRTIQIIIFLVSAVMVALLTYWVNFTKMGKALQAVAEDVTTASLLGINPEKFIVITFFISGALAGLAGTLVGSSVSIAGPYFGIAFGLKGLGVIVLGGLGSIPGAVIGGLLLGIAEAFVPAEYSGYREAIAFAILFIMLLVRPQGLLGRKLIQKV